MIRPSSVCVSTLQNESSLHLETGGNRIKGGVFGNDLKDIPKYTESTSLEEQELPKFLVKIVKSIEQKLDTVGLYRINGVASEVQYIR